MSLELQTRIVTTRDDWSLARFELLASISREKNDDFESRLFAVTTCGREPPEAANPVLSILYRGDFEEVWLSTVDTGAAFRQREYVGSPEPRTVQIDWPNCHPGADNELRQLEVAADIRLVRVDEWSPADVVVFLPSLPSRGVQPTDKKIGMRSSSAMASTLQWHSNVHGAGDVSLPSVVCIGSRRTTSISSGHIRAL